MEDNHDLRSYFTAIFSFLIIVLGFQLVCFEAFPGSVESDTFREFFPDFEKVELIPPTVFLPVGILFIVSGLCICTLLCTHWHDQHNISMLVISTVIFVSSLVLCVAAYVIKIDLYFDIESHLKNTQSHYYENTSEMTTSAAVSWDNIQKSQKCCGIRSYKEWAEAPGHPSTNFIPVSCCRNQSDTNCAANITIENYQWDSYSEEFVYGDGCLYENATYQLIIPIVFCIVILGIFFTRKESEYESILEY